MDCAPAEAMTAKPAPNIAVRFIPLTSHLANSLAEGRLLYHIPKSLKSQYFFYSSHDYLFRSVVGESTHRAKPVHLLDTGGEGQVSRGHRRHTRLSLHE